jgi:CRP-like cAMP-binding protein
MSETGRSGGFWGLLSEAERAGLSALARPSVFRPGTTLCVEGEPATHVFVLIAGWVKIISVTSKGSEVLLDLRGQGDIVGEMAGESAGYRTASIRAIDQVRSLLITHGRFSAFLDSNPGADHAYRRVVTQRWSVAAQSLRDRSTSSGSQRLARLLLDLPGNHGRGTEHGEEAEREITIAIPLSQEEIASLIGASRATVTRTLRDWRLRGLIRTGQRRITIRDLAYLRRIAGRRP